jgi:hypothetical protein
MTNTQIIFLVVVIAAVAAIALIWLKTQRTKRLRSRFGPEYGRAIEESGSSVRAEEHLSKLEKRVDHFTIRELTPAERSRFVEEWRSIQAQFVDDPKSALDNADRELGEVMTARGYPVTDFEQQSADLSVNHASVVEHYRAGHAISLRHAQGQASTEDLRQAMVHYRQLFADLVGEPEVARAATMRV